VCFVAFWVTLALASLLIGGSVPRESVAALVALGVALFALPIGVQYLALRLVYRRPPTPLEAAGLECQALAMLLRARER
jgi:hypothetical protein